MGLPGDVAAQRRLRPVVRRGLLGPHQPAGLGGLRVGAARPDQSPHAVPGPLAPEEDGVYQFVSRVARAYAGLGRADDARPSMKSEDVVPAAPEPVLADNAVD